MAIGSSKIGVMGGLVPGGSCTFNASGTFIVPAGVRTLKCVTAKGATGAPGNPGNTGGSGNDGSGGGGGGGFGPQSSWTCTWGGYGGNGGAGTGEVLAPDKTITQLVMVVLGLQVMLDLREIQAMLAQLGHQLRLLV